MEALKVRFGRLVAAHRRRLGMSQQQLADQSDLSLDTINRVERGVAGVKFSNIDRLAAALKVDPAELFTTELPPGALQRRELTNLVARLSVFSAADLAWIQQLIEVAVKPRRGQAE